VTSKTLAARTCQKRRWGLRAC